MPDVPAQPKRLAEALFDQVRTRVRRLQLAWGCVLAVGVTAAGILLFDGVNRIWALRESWVFLGTVVTLAGATIVFIRQGLIALLRGPSAHSMALEVEQARPDFMDSLVCAVELEARPSDDVNPIEHALLHQVREKLSDGQGIGSVFRERLRLRPLLVAAFVMAACLALALQSRAWQKAWCHWVDLRTGQNSGLILSGPQGPLPIHSDARLDVLIRRWEQQADVEYVDAEGKHSFRMNPATESHFSFTFYDLTSALRYRIVTPSLASPWCDVAIYTPPSFEAVEITLSPPEYTGLEPLVFNEFQDMSAPVGSRAEVNIRSQPGVRAELHRTRARQPLENDTLGGLEAEFMVDQDDTLSVWLVDADGHEMHGPDITLTARPDLPPVVDIVEPRKDVQAQVQETVQITARASDDYGVRRVVLTYAVSGGPRQSILLAAPTERAVEQNVAHAFAIANMGLEPGDVISYVVSVADNREPDAQEARSDIYFIVIRPKLDEKEQEGNEGEQMKLDLSAIIAEAKRLIRYTWDLLPLENEERSSGLSQLGRDVRDLRVEVRKTFNEVVKASGGMVPPPLPELFGAVDRELGDAIALSEEAKADDAIAPQERALAHLIKLENELMKNAMKSKGKGKSEQQQEQNQEQKEKEPGEQSSGQDALQALKNALQKAQDLAERQDRLNRSMEQSPQASPEAAAGLAEKQEGVRQGTETLAEALAGMQQAQTAARDMGGAAREMGRGSDRLGQNDVPTAERHGKRAANLLGAALSDLQDAIRKAAAERLGKLAKAAQQLADAQRQAADVSRELEDMPEPPEPQLKQAETTQRGLNEQADALRQAVERTAADMEEQFPEVTEAITEATRELDKEGLKQDLARAANALLYRKPGRAKTSQTRAANLLQHFSQGLENAAGKLPAMSREELLEAMRQMEKSAQETSAAMQQDGSDAMQELESIREKSSQQLDGLAAALGDKGLQELADQMAAFPNGGESPSAAGATMLRLFKAAVGVLERHLMAAEVRRKLDLSRRQSVPPEKYRRLVEQYFRELSREQ